MTVKFLTLPVTIFDNMPVKSQKCPCQNSKVGVSRAFWCVTGKKKNTDEQCVFFSVTHQSARDTPILEFCHGHFWRFTGIFWEFVTGKVLNFTANFSKIFTGKLENSRAFRKKVVTGTLKFVTGTSVLWSQNFWFTALITKVIFRVSLVASIALFNRTKSTQSNSNFPNKKPFTLDS